MPTVHPLIASPLGRMVSTATQPIGSFSYDGNNRLLENLAADAINNAQR